MLPQVTPKPGPRPDQCVHAEAVEQLWSELTFLRVSWQQMIRARGWFHSGISEVRTEQSDNDTDR